MRRAAGSFDAVNRSRVFDVDANVWTDVPRLPGNPGLFPASATQSGGAVVVAGTRCHAVADLARTETTETCTHPVWAVAVFDVMHRRWRELRPSTAWAPERARTPTRFRVLIARDGRAYFDVDGQLWRVDLRSGAWADLHQELEGGADACAPRGEIAIHDQAARRLLYVYPQGDVAVAPPTPDADPADPERLSPDDGTTARCLNGEVIVMNRTMTKVYLYETGTRTWRPLASAPIPGRLDSGNVVAIDNGLFLAPSIAAGDASGRQVKQYLFRVGYEAWEEISPVVSFRGSPLWLGDRFVGNGRFMDPTNAAERAGWLEWSPPNRPRAPLPKPRIVPWPPRDSTSNADEIVVADHSLLAVSGLFNERDGMDIVTTHVVQYDVEADRWRELPPVPIHPGLYLPAAVWTGHELVVAGSRCQQPSDPEADEEYADCRPGDLKLAIYNRNQNRWRTVPAPSSIRPHPGGNGVRAHAIGAVAGHAYFVFDHTLWDLQIDNQKWKSRGQIPEPSRVLSCATASRVAIVDERNGVLSQLDPRSGKLTAVPTAIATTGSINIACSDREVGILEPRSRRVQIIDLASGTSHQLPWPDVPGQLESGALLAIDRGWLLLVDRVGNPRRPASGEPVHWQHFLFRTGTNQWQGMELTPRYDTQFGPYWVGDRVIGRGGFKIDAAGTQVHGWVEWTPPV